MIINIENFLAYSNKVENNQFTTIEANLHSIEINVIVKPILRLFLYFLLFIKNFGYFIKLNSQKDSSKIERKHIIIIKIRKCTKSYVL